MSADLLLWDVDTQVDFVQADGLLAVPGAERLRPAFARLVSGFREAGLVHLASADDHDPGDPELSETPDFAETYPPHCLHGSPGAEKVPETRQDDPLVIPPEGLPGLEAALPGRREILVRKRRFDVFTNPSAARAVELLDPSEVIVFGVATDVCDDAAIRGLLRLGRRVSFAADAAAGIDPGRTERCLQEWREAGVELTTVDAVLARIRV